MRTSWASTVQWPFEDDIAPPSSPLPTGEGVVGHCRVGGGPQVLRCAATVLAQGREPTPGGVGPALPTENR